MMSLSLSLSYPTHHFTSYNKQLCALRSAQSHHTRISQHKLQQSSSFLGYNPLRVSIDLSGEKMKRRGGVVCSAVLAPRNLQWVCTISSVEFCGFLPVQLQYVSLKNSALPLDPRVLMLAKGTAIHKSFLVPLFALLAPTAVVSWIQGEYGIWSAFLALLVRLFFSFPALSSQYSLRKQAIELYPIFSWFYFKVKISANVWVGSELELPFTALLMVIVAPYQVANLRGTKEGVILSLAIAAYLGFQHFTRAGSLQKAFDQGSIIATLAIICILVVPCLLLI
ncbi:hypothetical protein RDI58_004970 [Solanum bulbocastanum]|uniref:Uncharacterized protein n=1 Tax=Solanum bulbocastanum TaxID=147425 RepID=A0AAN8TYK9_SOLBU